MSQPSEQDPDMRAAEYVLGTLSVEEAERVERELAHDRELQAEVAYWEEQLGQLGLRLAPVQPPAGVWDNIRARLADSGRAKTATTTAPTPRRSRLWPGLAMAASVAALVLAGMLFMVGTQDPGPDAPPTYASMLYDDPTTTGWLVTADEETGRMSVVAMGDYPLPEGKELRLWLIPEGGSPVALGTVPADGGHHGWAMSTQVARIMSEPANTLAVSMEDAGASVADGPQGPVMWQAPVTRRTG